MNSWPTKISIKSRYLNSNRRSSLNPPLISGYTQWPQQFDHLLNQILANPTQQQIDDHLEQPSPVLMNPTKFSSRHAERSRKRAALDDFLAYEPSPSPPTQPRPHALKPSSSTSHQRRFPKGFNHNSPDIKLTLVHQYRHQSQCHPLAYHLKTSS